jgi:hypothetical protein
MNTNNLTISELKRAENLFKYLIQKFQNHKYTEATLNINTIPYGNKEEKMLPILEDFQFKKLNKNITKGILHFLIHHPNITTLEELKPFEDLPIGESIKFTSSYTDLESKAIINLKIEVFSNSEGFNLKLDTPTQI